MRINYNRLLELNKESAVSTTAGCEQLNCFWVIQHAVERYLINDEITEKQKNLLLDLEILEYTEEEKTSQTIVGPFNFKNNGSTNS